MAQEQTKSSSNDSWISDPIPCGGGLILNVDPLTLGTKAPGAALVLQNFECSVDGGYRRLSGYTKFDTNVVPGTGSNPVLGVKVGLGGVFAVRKTSTDNRIYFSSGSGWGTKLNTTARTGAVTKARGIISTVGSKPAVILCDEFNYAWKWDGTTETIINGTGAPTNPKYCEIFYSRLVLAGYGNGNLVTFAAPISDTDFDAADGALEFNVGDTITGIKIFRNTLVIFCQRYIKQVTGDGSTNNPFVLSDVATSLGCLSADTIQEQGGDIIYLAGDTLRSYAATARINDAELASVAEQIQPLIREQILNQSYTSNMYSSCCIRHKSQYNLFINDPSNTQAETLGLRGRLKDTQSSSVNARNNYEWATLKGIRPSCADSDFTNNQEISIIGDPSNGLVYRLESGNDFDGTPISAIYRSPDITFDDATLRKTFQKITILSKVEGNFTSTLNLILERGDIAVIQPLAIPLSSMGSVVTYGTGIYDTSTYGQFSTPVFKRNLIGSGFLGAFQFTSNDSNAPYTINAYQIEFSLKGRR